MRLIPQILQRKRILIPLVRQLRMDLELHGTTIVIQGTPIVCHKPIMIVAQEILLTTFLLGLIDQEYFQGIVVLEQTGMDIGHFGRVHPLIVTIGLRLGMPQELI